MEAVRERPRVERAPDRRSAPAKRWAPPKWLKPLVFVLCLIPFVYLAYGFSSDFFRGTRIFGSEPIKEIEHFAGDWILRFLVITLSITPLSRITGQGWLVRYRRMFGLFAFFYATLHVLIYAILDVELSWSIMVEDVAKRIYITIGMTAFVMLLALAVTSTNGWVRRLGSARWKKLHRLVYVIVILGTIHYWMSVKRDIRDPAMYALIFAMLLGYRTYKSRGSRVESRGPDMKKGFEARG
jgi:methionine sulfoxide reductase heme-binding subunit